MDSFLGLTLRMKAGAAVRLFIVTLDRRLDLSVNLRLLGLFS